MRLPSWLVMGAVLAIGLGWIGAPVFAGDFHVGVIRSPAFARARSSASRMTAKANANASNAAGDPYVNPNVAAGHRTTQDNASANEDAAEIRNTHQNVTVP